MNGILEITLNGKKERLRFNNYARNELRRFFVPEDKGYLTEGELMKAIIEKWKENEHLLLKMLVYAGIVGDSLVNGFTSRVRQEDIGEYIGEAPAEELLEVWKAFLAAQGFDLSQEEKEEGGKEPELTPEEQKKKTKIT